MVVPVILCGGAGSRLWPLSRKARPKQFIALIDGSSPLQTTLRRLTAIDEASAPIVVCNEAHRHLALEQLQGVGVSAASLVLEPAARGTAPAAAAAALEALARAACAEDPLLLVLPVDHLIGNRARLARAVKEALRAAALGRLVTFGVRPSRAETGYGYIRAAPGGGGAAATMEIERFVEKPDRGAAAAYAADGRHWWNSGIFAFKARSYLEALREHAPDVCDAVVEAHRRSVGDGPFLQLDAASFGASPTASIDRAIMERVSGGAMVPLDAGWTDIGSWEALRDLGEPDGLGNVVEGKAVLEDVRESYVRADSGRTVAAVGVAGLVIVDTDDAVLVAGREAAQEVKSAAAIVDASASKDPPWRTAMRRPWGVYRILHRGAGFKVRSIVVDPGASLSLQLHRRRAQHWVVVRGVAQVTRGGDALKVSENDVVSISEGTRHRLENLGESPLEIVAVQVGDCLGEDDILRYDDACGRAGRKGVPLL